MPNQVGGDLLHTMDVTRLSRVRTELQMRLIVITLPPHPVEADGQFAGHRHLGDAAVTTHGQMHEATAPVVVPANGSLGCLYKEKAQQRTSLFGDVSQSLTIRAGVLAGNETEIAPDLLAAGEAPREIR